MRQVQICFPEAAERGPKPGVQEIPAAGSSDHGPEAGISPSAWIIRAGGGTSVDLPERQAGMVVRGVCGGLGFVKKTPLKTLPMPNAESLSAESLAMAIARISAEPNDGWADLTVHPSQLRTAMKLAQAHTSGMKVRVLADGQRGLTAWALRTRTAEVVSLFVFGSS